MITREIGFAHFGNGMVAYDRLNEEHGDYTKIAHISRMRRVKYYKELANHDIIQIEEMAYFNNGNISTTQEQKIFQVPAPAIFDKTEFKIARELYNSGVVYTGMTRDGEEITNGFDTYRDACSELLIIIERQKA